MEHLDITGRPTAKYVKNEKEFTTFLFMEYAQIATTLQMELALNPDNPKNIRQVELMKQVEVMIKKLDKPMHDNIDRFIKNSFMDGKAYHMVSIGDAESMTEARGRESFNAINKDRVEALVQDTYGDILMATKNTERHIKDLVRDTVKMTAQYHSLKNTNYTEQAEQLKKKLVKEGLSERIKKDGFVGIVDKKGRKWDINTYSKMVIKTKNNDAFKQGVMARAKEEGMDLAVISDHGADDACSKWEGVIISMSGDTEGYPSYAEARGSNQVFHPNCEHTLHPIRSEDDLHPDDIFEAKKKAQKLKYKRLPKGTKPDTKPNTKDAVKDSGEPPVDNESLYELVKKTDTDFYEKIGEKHYDKIFEKLKDAPKAVGQVWAKYEHKLRPIDMSNSDGAYYSPQDFGVFMNLEKDSKGTNFSTPYQVVYHEFSHNIDFMLSHATGGSRFKPFSYNYKDNKFGKTLQAEFDDKIKEIDKKLKAEYKENMYNPDWLYEHNLITEMGRHHYKENPEELLTANIAKYTKAQAYSAFQKEIRNIPLMERGNLSDIIEGASKAKVSGGIGHGKGYWKNEQNLPCEAFAEMIDSSIANKPALEQIKKYFPVSYEVFEEMLQVIINL